jgi:hypothetical protein
MPFIQKSTISKPVPNIFNLDDYIGGLNNAKSSFILNNNESPNVLNMYSYERGSIETRPGYIKYLLNLISETPEKIFNFQTADFNYLLIASGTRFFKLDLELETVSELTQNGITPFAGTVDGFQKGDKFYLVDGSQYLEFDGTSFYKIEQPKFLIDSPEDATINTIKFKVDPTVEDDFYVGWYITFNKGIASTDLLDVRKIISYDSNTKYVTVDEDFDQVPTVADLFYLTDGEQNVTTKDENSKTIKYTPGYGEVDNNEFFGFNIVGSVKNAKQIIQNKNYVLATKITDDENSIYISVNGNPYYFVDNSTQKAISSDNDPILGIISYNDVVAVFKNNSIYALYGDDPTTFKIREVTVSTGTASFDTVCKTDNNIMYLGNNGRIYQLYDLRSDVVKLLTKDVSSEQIILQQSPINLYQDDFSIAKAIYFDKNYFLFMNNKVLVYNGWGWFLWEGINPTALINYEGILLFSDSTKYIYRLPMQPYMVTESFIATAGQKEFDLYKGYLGEYSGTTLKINGVENAQYYKEINNNSKFVLEDEVVLSAGSTLELEYLSMLGYNDNGNTYLAKWESKDEDMGYPTKIKQIRQFNITCHTYKWFSSLINVEILVDHNAIETEYEINNRISLWGIAKFGDRFINNNIVDSTKIRVSKRGRIFRFRLSTDTANNPFKLYSLYGEYYVKNRGV